MFEFMSCEQCPRQQDSNLRSRPRRGLLYTPLTSANESPHTITEGPSGAGALIAAHVRVDRGRGSSTNTLSNNVA